MHFINYTFRKSTKITQINNIIAYGVTVESFYDHTCLYALFEFPVCMFLIHEHSVLFFLCFFDHGHKPLLRGMKKVQTI